MDERKRIVAAGYDAIADRFAEWRRGISGMSGLERVERLLERLPERPDVLELGIGAGSAPSRLLAERGRLTGVDISAEQARRAQRALPAAIVVADIADVELPGSAFDAVVALYSLNHVPREELAPLLERVHGWLRPGGVFLATFATGDSAGWRGEWLGAEMFFSGYDVDTTLSLVRGSPLELLESDVETIVEPDFGEGRWLWVLARRGDAG